MSSVQKLKLQITHFEASPFRDTPYQQAVDQKNLRGADHLSASCHSHQKQGSSQKGCPTSTRPELSSHVMESDRSDSRLPRQARQACQPQPHHQSRPPPKLRNQRGRRTRRKRHRRNAWNARGARGTGGAARAGEPWRLHTQN